MASAHTAATALRIIDMLATEAGAAALFFGSNGLERAIRDVQAATRHIALGPGLGLDPGTAGF